MKKGHTESETGSPWKGMRESGCNHRRGPGSRYRKRQGGRAFLSEQKKGGCGLGVEVLKTSSVAEEGRNAGNQKTKGTTYARREGVRNAHRECVSGRKANSYQKK